MVGKKHGSHIGRQVYQWQDRVIQVHEQVSKHCKARQGKARQGKARQGKARQGKARQGKARQGKARQGKARQGRLSGLCRVPIAKIYAYTILDNDREEVQGLCRV